MIKRLLVCIVSILLMISMGGGSALAQEISDLSTAALPRKVEKRIDFLLSGHVSGFFPQDRDFFVGGNRVANTDVRGTIGAGIKFEAYPWFTKKVLGAEIEAFGLGGSVRAPRTTSGSGTTQAQASLIAVSTMYSLMLRYPDEVVQPYIGIGAGTSTGILYNTNITSGNVGLTGSSGDFAFAYQFLGGVRTFVTKKLFIFGEYKYFATRYGWESEGAGSQKVKLDFQTHILSGGIGWSF